MALKEAESMILRTPTVARQVDAKAMRDFSMNLNNAYDTVSGPMRMGANIPFNPQTGKSQFDGFNPTQKGLMDSIYPWWWEEREWPRRAVITEWFYNPLKGQPRYIDVNQLRLLAKSEWVKACTQVIRREIESTPWDIVPKDPAMKDDPPSDVQQEIEYVKFFLNDCNPNHESIETVVSMAVQDLLELDAGTFVKGFTQDSYITTPAGGLELAPRGQRQLVEMWARDGGSFLAETDVNGVKYRWWQYSYLHPAVAPIEFDINEISYFMEYPAPYSVYGWSPLQSLDNILSSLINSAAWNTNFFSEATLPSGLIGVPGLNPEELERFRQYFRTEIKGRWHRIAVVNQDVKYVPFALTNRDMQWLDGQQWYFKIVLMLYNVTPTEMGLTDDIRATGKAMGAQDDVSKRKSIIPILRKIEQVINNTIVSELAQKVMFQYKPTDRSEELMQIDVDNKDITEGKKTINEVRKARGLGSPLWFGEEPEYIIAARITRGEPIPPLQLPQKDQAPAAGQQTPEIQRDVGRVPLSLKSVDPYEEAFNLVQEQHKAWPPTLNEQTGLPHTQDDTLPHTQNDQARENRPYKGMSTEKEISGNRIGWGKEQKADYLGRQEETIPGATQGVLPTAIGRKPHEWSGRDGMIYPTDVGGEAGAYPIEKRENISLPNPESHPDITGVRGPGTQIGGAFTGEQAGEDYERKPYDDTIELRSEKNRPKDDDTAGTRITPGDPLSGYGNHPWEQDGMNADVLYGARTGVTQIGNPAYQKTVQPSDSDETGVTQFPTSHIQGEDTEGKPLDFEETKSFIRTKLSEQDLSVDNVGETKDVAEDKLNEYFDAFSKERGEHPDFSNDQIWQIVQDHKKDYVASPSTPFEITDSQLQNKPTHPAIQRQPEHDDGNPQLDADNPQNLPMDSGPQDTLDEYMLDRLRQGPAGPTATVPKDAWHYPGPSEDDRGLIEGDSQDSVSTTRKAKPEVPTVGYLREPTSDTPMTHDLPQYYGDQNPLHQFGEDDLRPSQLPDELTDYFKEKGLDLSSKLRDQIQRFAKFTSETKKEFGALILRKQGQIILDQVQVGQEHAINIEPTRPLEPDEEILGSYHQHPNSSEFSPWDLLSFLHSGWEHVSILSAANGDIIVAIKTPQTKPIAEEPEQLREQYNDWSNEQFASQFGFLLYRGSVDNLEEVNKGFFRDKGWVTMPDGRHILIGEDESTAGSKTPSSDKITTDTIKRGDGSSLKVTSHGDVKDNSLFNLNKHFDGMSNAEQANIKDVQVYEGKSQEFTIGDNRFQAAGAYEAKSGTLSIYNANTSLEDEDRTQYVLDHEAGHGCYDEFRKYTYRTGPDGDDARGALAGFNKAESEEGAITPYSNRYLEEQPSLKEYLGTEQGKTYTGLAGNENFAEANRWFNDPRTSPQSFPKTHKAWLDIMQFLNAHHKED